MIQEAEKEEAEKGLTMMPGATNPKKERKKRGDISMSLPGLIFSEANTKMNPGDEKKRASSPMEDHSLPSLAYSPNLCRVPMPFPAVA